MVNLSGEILYTRKKWHESSCLYWRTNTDSVFTQLWIYAVCREFCVVIVTQQRIGTVMFDLRKKFCWLPVTWSQNTNSCF